MKKIILTLVFAVLLIPLAGASAQMMYGATQNASSTANRPLDAGEAAGQAIAVKLQTKTFACADVSQDNYESLGDYYMGLMMGSSHDAMEQNIEKAYSADYLRSMHIAMGERFSGCNVNASFPAGMMGFGPMMGENAGSGMMNGYNAHGNYYPSNGMMNWPGMMGGYFGGYGWITTILVWVLLALGIAAAVKWLRK